MEFLTQLLGENEKIEKNKNNDYIRSSFQVINLLFNKNNLDKEDKTLKNKINEETNKLENKLENEIVDKNNEKKEKFKK